MNYNDDGTPSHVESVVLCVQTENLCHEEYLMFKELLIQKISSQSDSFRVSY